MRAFALHLGFVRFACENRALVREGRIFRVSVHHRTAGIVEAIEIATEALEFDVPRLVARFQALSSVVIPRNRLRPIVLSALRISKPDGMN